ncbi:hypothetical protein [Luteimonas salinilitoris]|uniref:Uncharacterized protein n=1 Tax=Luteimonas salinilitoris TaxID=3237697 RepID=A0ABV4HTQ2_9GAMM
MQQRAAERGDPRLQAFDSVFCPGTRSGRRLAHAAGGGSGVRDFMRDLRRATCGVRHRNATGEKNGVRADRLSWQIVPRDIIQMHNSPDSAAATRAMQAMMTMKKLDIAALRAAYEGK